MAKKYFWLKLKEDFFDDDAINWLEEQPKGKEYALFYLKLCLKSLKTDGILIRTVGTMLVPYDMKKLSEITKTEFDTVVVAMELLKNIGLVEILENGEIFLPGLHQMVGSETKWARYKRKDNILENFQENSNNSKLENFQEASNDSKLENFQEASNDVPKKVQTENRDRDKEIDNNIIVAPAGNGPNDTPDDIQEKYPIGDFEYQCVDILIRSCVAVFPNSKVPKTEAEKRKWAVEIERMKRLDGRIESDIVEALTYATTDGFWKSNIRSTKKFREKFETLIVQSRGRQGKNIRANCFNQFPQNNYDMQAIERELLANGGDVE
ncbi:hypothetical protein C809_02194 [Lachnospiraceae bacterium MD335]|nr:hypothetical protein C809_02194 [Lachnospiraceae bacterium MD335]